MVPPSLPPSLLAILAQRGCHPSAFLTLTRLKPLVRTFEPPIDGGGGGGGRWRLNDIILNLTPPPLLPKQSEKRGRGGGRFYFLLAFKFRVTATGFKSSPHVYSKPRRRVIILGKGRFQKKICQTLDIVSTKQYYPF